MTDFRALCAKMAEDIRYLSECLRNPDDGHDPVCLSECESDYQEARAALAQPAPPAAEGEGDKWEQAKENAWDKHKTIGYQGERFMYESDFDLAVDLIRDEIHRSRPAPEPPAEGEVEPSREDLLRIAEQAAHIDQDGIFDALEEGYPLELTALDILEICRAVYRLGRPANPPAEGEVAELVAWLPRRPECFEFALDFLGEPENDKLRAYVEQLEARAALAQHHPAPVPLPAGEGE